MDTCCSKQTIIISPRKLRSDLYQNHDSDNNNNTSTPLVISVLASLIERSMARNERIFKNYKDTTSSTTRSNSTSSGAFDCYMETPDMSIQGYLERIYRYTKAAPCVYVVAYVYIDRFCQANPGFRISASNVHRLLITTIMVASKYVEDMNYRNSYFARVGGVEVEELNRLEVDFLFMIGFKLHVNVSVFESYCCHLEREVSIGGGYQIEKALRCAQDINSRRDADQTYPHIAPNYICP